MKSTMKVADEDDNIQYARTAVTITVERFVNRTMLRAAFSMVIGKQQQQDVQSSSDKYSPDVGRSCSRRRFSFDGDDGDHERHYRQGPETTDAAIPAACSPSSPRLPSRHHHYYSATTHTSPMKRFSSLVSFGLLVAVMFLAQAHIFSRIRFLQTDKVSTQASSSSSISGSSTELIRSSDDGKGLTRVSGEESDRLQRNLPHRVPLPIASGKDPSTTKEQEAPDNNRHESSTNTDAAETSDDFWSILSSAGRKAFRGGYAGALAAVVQVCSLMWLRTVMNYQYRYGGNMRTSLRKLWSEGGLARLYQGLPFALVQGPLSKFGDTAANGGALALLNALSPLTRGWPLVVKTACGSTAAGLWRIFLMPVDAAKTAMQVEGRDGLHLLWRSVADARSPGPLYRGAFAQAAATAVGHFPWFATYNFLNSHLPVVESGGVMLTLLRSACLGVAASCVSDCMSNSLRVIKTTKQTINKDMRYAEVVSFIVEKDGVTGLFGRGLQTRLLTNAIQGALFSVLWKYFQRRAAQ